MLLVATDSDRQENKTREEVVSSVRNKRTPGHSMMSLNSAVFHARVQPVSVATVAVRHNACLPCCILRAVHCIGRSSHLFSNILEYWCTGTRYCINYFDVRVVKCQRLQLTVVVLEDPF